MAFREEEKHNRGKARLKENFFYRPWADARIYLGNRPLTKKVIQRFFEALISRLLLANKTDSYLSC